MTCDAWLSGLSVDWLPQPVLIPVQHDDQKHAERSAAPS